MESRTSGRCQGGSPKGPERRKLRSRFRPSCVLTWKAPGDFKIDFFVIRVGEWGGHMLMECDDPVTIHKFCSMLPAFVFEVHPVIPVEEAVRGELEVIAWRDGLKGQ